MTDTTRDFYDGLAADYHLVYGDRWDDAVRRQGAMLDRLLGGDGLEVLDCACGIGTQAIGLALRGHRVRGTDLSPGAVRRARVEAARLGAEVAFGVADFRDLSDVAGEFDVVLACDNALPHLLDDAEIERALRAMHAKLRPGGRLVVGIRDFDAALVDRPVTAAPIVIDGPPRRLVLRLHDWDAPDSRLYTVRLLVLEEGGEGWAVREHVGRYRAIRRAELSALVERAGFAEVRWHGADEAGMHQPLLTARA